MPKSGYLFRFKTRKDTCFPSVNVINIVDDGRHGNRWSGPKFPSDEMARKPMERRGGARSMLAASGTIVRRKRLSLREPLTPLRYDPSRLLEADVAVSLRCLTGPPPKSADVRRQSVLPRHRQWQRRVLSWHLRCTGLLHQYLRHSRERSTSCHLNKSPLGFTSYTTSAFPAFIFAFPGPSRMSP